MPPFRIRRSTCVTSIAALVVFSLCFVFVLEWKCIETLRVENDFSKMGAQVLPRTSVKLNPNERVNIRVENNFSKVEAHILPRTSVEMNPNKLVKNYTLDMKEFVFNLTVDFPENFYKVLKSRNRHELILSKGIREFWWYARKSMEELSVGGKRVNSDTILRSIAQRYNSLQWRLSELMDHQSNHGEYELNWKYWQTRLSKHFTTILEKRIDRLQNPLDCKSAKKLVCHVAKACGFGCQIHHVSYCFILAYATQRTLVLDSSGWKYSPNGWNVIFKPISSTCSEIPTGNDQ